MDILKKLKLPDYLSIISLFLAWISIILLITGFPLIAITINMGAFIFDILDGYAARKLNTASKIGRELDSFVDIFTYVVFTAVLFHYYLAPNMAIGILISFLMILFGGLRLQRYNEEGILKEKGKEFYRGVTVVHLNFIAIYIFYLNALHHLNSWIGTVLLLLMIPFLLSNFKSYKIKNPLFFIILISLTVYIALHIANGN